jgi:putative flippase GtrA
VAVAEPAAEVKRLGLFSQLSRFVIIGGVCAVIDFGTYSLMLGVLGWPVWLSRGLSFIIGTSTSYVVNRKLTFHGANTGNTTAKAGGFALVYIVTFFVNWGTNQLLVVLTGAAGHPWLITLCWVIGQGLGTLINFVMLKWVVFRD